MKLIRPDNSHITINDNSEEAKKILQGFDYDFTKQGVIIKPNKIHYDISGFEKKINTGIQNNSDTVNFLKELVKVYKKIKYNIN